MNVFHEIPFDKRTLAGSMSEYFLFPVRRRRGVRETQHFIRDISTGSMSEHFLFPEHRRRVVRETQRYIQRISTGSMSDRVCSLSVVEGS